MAAMVVTGTKEQMRKADGTGCWSTGCTAASKVHRAASTSEASAKEAARGSESSLVAACAFASETSMPDGFQRRKSRRSRAG